jgi:hypothetical protein
VKRKIILDTGPLVAVLNLRDTYRDWTKAQFSKVEALLLSRMCNVRPGPAVVYQSLKEATLEESLGAEARLAVQVYRLSARLCADGCQGCLHSGSDLMEDTLAESAVSRRLLGRFVRSIA